MCIDKAWYYDAALQVHDLSTIVDCLLDQTLGLAANCKDLVALNYHAFCEVGSMFTRIVGNENPPVNPNVSTSRFCDHL